MDQSNEECNTDQVQELISLFDDVKNFLSDEHFTKDLQEELLAGRPNYKEDLELWRNDLTRSDCGIVIAGDTSTGKTSLINQIVGRKIFVPRNLAATATICRIRNSTKPRIIVSSKDGEKLEDMHVDESAMRKHLKIFTDRKKMPEKLQGAHFVDVYLPVPILKGNIIIVDTPGVGTCADLDDKLLSFLTNAVSFIFLVNVRNIGGVKKLNSILEFVIKCLQEMPSFDPADVIFVTNMWDCIEETDLEDTRTYVEQSIYEEWRWIKKENIFRCSLKQVKKKESTEYTEEYDRFYALLQRTISRNENKRVKMHFRNLVSLMKIAQRGILTRLHQFNQTKEEHEMSIDKTAEGLMQLNKYLEHGKNELEQLISQIEEDLSKALLETLKSGFFEDQTLNPSEGAIKKVSYKNLGKEVFRRLNDNIKLWCEGSTVQDSIKTIDDRIMHFACEIEHKMTNITVELTGFSDKFISARSEYYYAFGEVSKKFADIKTMFEMAWFLRFKTIFSTQRGHQKKAAKLYKDCVNGLKQEDLADSFKKSFGKSSRQRVTNIYNASLENSLTIHRALNTKHNGKIDIETQRTPLCVLNGRIEEIKKKMEEMNVKYELDI